MPAVSVVMSVFNGEAYLREAVDSVLAQSFTDFEFIIIDDGSSDRTSDIIRSYKDSRIVFIQQKNAGLAQALNNGIAAAKSEVVARMDADDICLPDRLQVQMDFLYDNPDIIALGSAALYIDEQGNEVSQVFMPEQHQDILSWLPESPIIHPSSVFKKAAFFRAGGYSKEFFCAQDAVLFNKLARLGRLHNLQISLLKYRISRDATSRRTVEQNRLLQEIIQRYVTTDQLSARDIAQLENMRSRVSIEEKSFSYHVSLAKLYLWSGQSRRARQQAVAALRIIPNSSRTVLLVVLTLLPDFGIKMLKAAFDNFKRMRRQR